MSFSGRAPSSLVATGLLALVLGGSVGCHLTDVLKVPIPDGVASSKQLQNQTGAEGRLVTGESDFFSNIYSQYSGLIQWTGMLADEFKWSAFSQTYSAADANIDFRETAMHGGFYEFNGDGAWSGVLRSREELALALAGLRIYEPASGQSKIGSAYMFMGYADVFIAEAYCDGTPLLDAVLPTGGYQFGTALSDDSILAIAEMDFDSALAYAGGNDTVTNVASVGLARAMLDRGKYDSASAVAQGVSASFVYNSIMSPNYNTACCTLNIWAGIAQNGGNAQFNVADMKGENGMPFISAHDPRLTYDSTSYTTQDGGKWYLPGKFAGLTTIPVATGLEAALIVAEAALHDGNAGTWLTDLNALRTNGSMTITGPDTTWGLGTGQVSGQVDGLAPLTDPGTDTGRVSLMFRERAFWLFGQGSRLGDLRRLVHVYGRDTSLVYPHGPYPNGSNPNMPTAIATYGLDVDITLPTSAAITAGYVSEANPNFKGCTTPTTTP